MLLTSKLALMTMVLAAGAAVTGAPRLVSEVSPADDLNPDVLSGRVVAESTASAPPSVAGAAVSVSTIPNLRLAKKGQVLDIVPIAKTKTDSTGSFSLRIPRSRMLLSAAAENGGWVNMTAGIVLANSDSRTITFSWNLDSGLVTGDLSEYQQPNLVITLKYDANGALVNGVPHHDGSYEPSRLNAIAYGCQFVVDSTFQRYTHIVNGHSASKSKIKVSYGQTADSDVDTGFKPFNGSWGISGSVHVGNSSTVGSDLTIYGSFNGYVDAKFSYVKGHIRDYFGAPNGTVCQGVGYRVGDQSVKAQDWVGGGLITSTGPGSGARSCLTPPRSNHRTVLLNGGHSWISSSTQTRISAAVSTPYLTLGARSGFSVNVRQDWWGTSGNGVYICGQYGNLNQSPGIVYVTDR